MSDQEKENKDANYDGNPNPSVLHSLESIQKSICKTNTRLETLEKHKRVEQVPQYFSRLIRS